MTPEELAALYARAAPDATAWRTSDFRDVLNAPGGFLCTVPHAFALGRTAADEAELILIASHPDHRRRGLAAQCLSAFHAKALRRGAKTAFLEVAESNRAARALYAKAGYTEAGRRKGYYAGANGRETALILRRPLTN